jgi:hypothetical protein
MNHRSTLAVKQFILSLALLVFFLPSFASNESEPDYSGRYLCKGENSRVGEYEVNIVLKKNKVGSNQEFSVYDITEETENATSYYGNAIVIGNRLALTFRLLNGKAIMASTGLATMRVSTKNNWSFVSRYYEPNDGGVYGTDDCKLEK